MSMHTAFAVSADGTRIAYDVSGSGPALMLLHGGMMTRASWHEAGYVTRLQGEFRVITVDLRGNGESAKPTDPAAYTTEKLGQDVLAVADACGVERFTLWGYSYGGNVGRYLAARSPRVAKLIIIGIPFGLGADGEFRQRILGMRAHWAPIVEGLGNGTLDPTGLSPEDQAGMQHWDIPVTLAWMSAMLDWPAITPADLPCPTLWLVGSQNIGALDSVREYEPALEGSNVMVQIEPGLTHIQEFSEIDQVFPALLRFTQAA
jgi:pimeloyl-ACP methyl ester carboxylesterase